MDEKDATLDVTDSSQEAGEASNPMPAKAEIHLAMHVCEDCAAANLVVADKVQECEKCKVPYCIHFASRIDQNYCVSCMSNVSVEKQVIRKTYEHYDEETDTITTYSRKARLIKLDGLDWLFAQRKIPTLTDAELDIAIEYHRNIMMLLVDEYERRRNEKMHRYAGIPIKIPTDSTSTVTKTTVTKSTKTTSSKQSAVVKSLMDLLLKKGLTAEQCAALLKK